MDLARESNLRSSAVIKAICGNVFERVFHQHIYDGVQIALRFLKHAQLFVGGCTTLENRMNVLDF